MNLREYLALSVGLLVAALWPAQAAAQAADALSERDWFEELPVVLSVSRLAQPLSEAPGAVTVIDRDTIRRSGARELVDLLRLVPGFQVTQLNGAFPFATYHADFDSLNRRLQVFVDGRSVYSGLFVGNVSHGMMGVVLDDIERIEVMRGSNSAAYGANAFLGVINIVTRNASDVRGGMISATRGGSGIDDSTARFGWGTGDASFRLTAAQRKDDGFDSISDDKGVKQLHWRGDLKLRTDEELMLAAGTVAHHWGAGAGTTTDPARTERWRSAYVHGQWRGHLEQGGELRLNASYDDEAYMDVFPYTGFKIDGKARRYNLGAQHTFVPARDIRAVWGVEASREEVDSVALFNTSATQFTNLWRLFGNAEWHLGRSWVLNVGTLLERHNLVATKPAPRLMLNYHVAPGHTLRVGATTAYRTPTLFELRGNWKGTYSGIPGITLVKATGGMKPERLDVGEVGYLGAVEALGLTLDVRGFRERMNSRAAYWGQVPPGKDIVNLHPLTQRGWEMQARFNTSFGAQIWFNHTVLKVLSYSSSLTTLADDRLTAPSHASTLAWFQRLPQGFDLTVIYTTTGQMTWGTAKATDMLPAVHQLDLRLGRRFKVGATDAEFAITTQGADGSHPVYSPTQIFNRRTYATLRLDF